MSQLKTKKATPQTVAYKLFEFGPTYRTGDYTGLVETKTMSVEDFIKIPTFPVNRAVEQRAKRNIAHLLKPIPKHAEVDVLVYTGPTTNTPAYFQTGASYVMDGNTRKFIWERYMQGNPIDPKTTCLPIPESVTVRVYECDNAFEAAEQYYAIDSVQAVETKADKVTGAFRSENLLDKFQNSKLKAGTIGTSLTVAVPTQEKSGLPTPDTNGDTIKDLFGQVRLIRQGLIVMDKINAPGRGHFHVQVATGVALMAGHACAYSDEWCSAVAELAKFKPKDHWNDENSNGVVANTALTAMMRGNKENVCGEHNSMPYDIGWGQNPALVKNYLAYCWLKFIDEEPVDYWNITTKDIDSCYFKLWNRAYQEQN